MIVDLGHDFKSTLGSSLPHNFHKPSKAVSTEPKAQRGSKGMSGEQKRLLRASMVLLQRKRKKENLVFGTCTIPDLDTNEIHIIAAYWGEAVKQMCQKITRELIKAGIVPEIIFVTELQTERWNKYKVVAPHGHLVFQGRKDRNSPWIISTKRFTEMWEEVLSNILKREIKAPWATNIQRIKVSVKRYLSKYLSKGGAILDEIKEAGLTHLLPRSWFYCTRSLKQEAKAARVKVEYQLSMFIYDHREYLKAIGIISWYYVIQKDFIDYQTGFTITRNIGWVGGFNDKIPIPILLNQLEVLMFEYVNNLSVG